MVGEVNTAHGAISVRRARHLVTLNGGHGGAIDALYRDWLPYRYAITETPPAVNARYPPSASGVEAVGNEDCPIDIGSVHGILDDSGRGVPRQIGSNGVGARLGDVMDGPGEDMNSHRRAYSSGIAVIIGPQSY